MRQRYHLTQTQHETKVSFDPDLTVIHQKTKVSYDPDLTVIQHETKVSFDPDLTVIHEQYVNDDHIDINKSVFCLIFH